MSRGTQLAVMCVLTAALLAAVQGAPVTVTPLESPPPPAAPKAAGASPSPSPSPSPVLPLGAVFPVFVPFPAACAGVDTTGPSNNPALNCILALQPGNPAAQSLPALLNLVGAFNGKK